MRHIYLIARREYLSYVATIGFWVSLAMIPVFLLLGMALPALMDRASGVRNFTIIDHDGRYERAIEQSFMDERAEHILEFIDSLILVEGETEELLAAKTAAEENKSETEIRSMLGTQRSTALAAKRESFNKVPPPANTIEALRPFLLEEKMIDTVRGPEPLHAAAFVYLGNDGIVQIEYWSANISERRLQGKIRRAVREQMQKDEFSRSGIELALVEKISDLKPVIISLSPEKAADNAKVTAEDRLPFIISIIFAFILWSVVFSVANMLLTSVIEEKSNKILDSLLSAAPLRSILMGKLLGVAMVSFTLLAGWVLAGLVSMLAAGSVIDTGGAGRIASILSAAGDPWLIIPFFGYFIFGYLMFGSIFLALGSLCETLQEAQTLMTPMIFLMMVPMFALGFAMQDPESSVLAVLSWIPLFTPYIMMARLPTDPPMIEIIGTTLVMVTTTFVVLLGAGKVFQAGAMHQAGSDYFKNMFSKLLPKKKKKN
ncbi:MAG: ABC transporter permease [Robiginitomaculum sp.]|nr:ABC transporter permease [Robiginitomaculum sp.]